MGEQIIGMYRERSSEEAVNGMDFYKFSDKGSAYVQEGNILIPARGGSSLY